MRRGKLVAAIFVGLILLGVGLGVLKESQIPATTEVKPLTVTEPKINKTLYVSTDGSDQSDGSEQSPYASIQRALDEAGQGTKVLIQQGSYTVSALHSVHNGTDEAPIILEASGEVEIKGTEKSSRLIEINHDYIHLIGLKINGLRGAGDKKEDYVDKLIYAIGKDKKNGVQGLKFDRLTVENAGGECIRLRYFALENEIANSTIRNCGAYDFKFGDGGKNGEGIYIGTAPEQRADGKNPTEDLDESRKNWIHDNVIDTQGNECVDIKEAARGNLVERNKCTGQKDPNSAGYDSRGDNNVFRDNEVHDVIGAGFRLGGDENKDGINNTVQNNLIKNAKAGGIKATRLPQADICGNTFEDIPQNKYFSGLKNEEELAKPCQT